MVSARWAHSCSRALARAARTRSNAAGSILSRTRHAVAVEATGPNNVGWSRSTARSLIERAPSASSTARSVRTRHGSWPEQRSRNPASAVPNAVVSPVQSASPARSRDPTCDTTSAPSVVTVIVGRTVVRCTRGVPLCAVDLSLKNSDPTALSRHFRAFEARVGHQRRLPTATAGLASQEPTREFLI